MDVVMQEHYSLIQQCRQVKLKAVQQGDTALQEHCQKCVQQWQGVMENMIDTQTASILQVCHSECQH